MTSTADARSDDVPATDRPDQTPGTSPSGGPGGERAGRRRPRVVVVGGGFAGLSAVRELKDDDVDVVLLDRYGYNTFQPLLYQVATGGLNPGDVTYPLRAFGSRFQNASYRKATVIDIDKQNKQVVVADGPPVEYDYLILCTGVTANFFGIPGAEKYARTIYTRKAALRVRDQIFASLEMTAQGKQGIPEPVVVVVGGGATGVEMAGTLAELRNYAVPVAYPEMDAKRVRVILVEMMDNVLMPFAPPLRDYTAQALRKRGVELRLNTAVKEVREHSVIIGDEEISSALTIWATGVAAHPVVQHWGVPQGRGGRIQTDPDMRIQGFEDIFAVGDVGARDKPAPQLAQPAIQGGKHAAVQIRRLIAGQPTQEFVYKDKGNMATIGRNDAVVQLPSGIKMKGFPAWAAWVALHIVTLTGNRNRFSTLTNLAVRYLSWAGNLNVIVGDPLDDPDTIR